MFDDLRGYLNLLDEKGLLKRVENVDWNVELGAITEIMAFSRNPKALLFDKIKNYPDGFQVATNLFVTSKLQALALGLPENISGIGLVKAFRERLHSSQPIKPHEVSDGPVKENTMTGDEVDVLKFPVPIWHEGDGGRYFGTGDCVITKDPEEGWVNMGTYRLMVHDRKTLGLFCVPSHHGMIHIEKYWAKDEDAPVVITEGQDPALYAASNAPLPWGYSELDFAGALRGRPVDVIVDEETGLPVPATAEIAVFGHVVKGELRDEGPFGECTGYSSPVTPKPVIHIDRIWYRNNPILQGNPTMRGISASIHALGAELMTSAWAWDSVEKDVMNVTGVYSLFQPCQVGSPMIAISIKQAFPGHARQAALAVLASHAVALAPKIVVVVDDDIDPSDIRDVLWAITTRCNPGQDVDIIRGISTNPLDPSVTPQKREMDDITTEVMIIDATRKPFGFRDKFPKVNRINPELEARLVAKWGAKLGLE
ncbi:MAG: UbiD family decarboxylase [Conexivisphaera sp.]